MNYVWNLNQIGWEVGKLSPLLSEKHIFRFFPAAVWNVKSRWFLYFPKFFRCRESFRASMMRICLFFKHWNLDDIRGIGLDTLFKFAAVWYSSGPRWVWNVQSCALELSYDSRHYYHLSSKFFYKSFFCFVSIQLTWFFVKKFLNCFHAKTIPF